ncbi:unnamed protein product [Linum tenue]|uniref:Tetrahydrofolate dehydrogenase/cyclohydrolase catalytic domain-containing protein n=1 Tax=Linum tenue TaxID=586396 RepID=A0AAV0QMN5_9ROSI|nr:unnamed protein product [Linum tenue]
MKDAIGAVPGLAVILVGDRKDSATYVRNKKKACESAGINSFEVRLQEDSAEAEVLKHIAAFNVMTLQFMAFLSSCPYQSI